MPDGGLKKEATTSKSFAIGAIDAITFEKAILIKGEGYAGLDPEGGIFWERVIYLPLVLSAITWSSNLFHHITPVPFGSSTESRAPQESNSLSLM